MPMNREKFERMLDEIAAEYPGAEKAIMDVRDAMDAEGGDMEAGAEEEMDIMESDDLEGLPMMPKKKPSKKPVDEEEDEEDEIF